MYKLLIVLISLPLWAQDVSQDEIMSQLKALKSASVAEYAEKMQGIGELSREYIRTKEQECSGTYSSLVLDNKGEKQRVKNKLSKKEKQLCLYLLVDFRIKFTRLSYEIRKEHLKLLHVAQIEELQTLEGKQILELEKLAKKFK